MELPIPKIDISKPVKAVTKTTGQISKKIKRIFVLLVIAYIAATAAVIYYAGPELFFSVVHKSVVSDDIEVQLARDTEVSKYAKLQDKQISGNKGVYLLEAKANKGN